MCNRNEFKVLKQYTGTQTRLYIYVVILHTLHKQSNTKADLWIMPNWKELLLNHSKELNLQVRVKETFLYRTFCLKCKLIFLIRELKGFLVLT
jgi:hypothetical protein